MPIGLTLGPGKIMEQVTLSAVLQHVPNNQGIEPCQHGFVKDRSCFTHLNSFCDKGGSP